MSLWAALFLGLKLMLENLWQEEKRSARSAGLAAAAAGGVSLTVALLLNWASPFLKPESDLDVCLLFFWSAF